ncbi:MAG: glutathione peroxidase [Tenericutes bacterium HGW-Tenericutes-3]|nr:MAG: glutathione peroxidase [Tenericutes bacterium HGW-Tenericutes-3]
MNIYDFKVKNTKQQEVSLSNYKGKVLLIVNTATKCGFTPQYEGLEALYEKYKDKGFEVLDFPCNQFLHQAPGTDAELKSFCSLNFGTKFETFARVDVNGKNADPLFVFLRNQINRDITGARKPSILSKLATSDKIKWNFTKFLVNREGKVVHRFAPGFEPKDIEKYLDKLI